MADETEEHEKQRAENANPSDNSELRASAALPGVVANRFLVMRNRNGVRLAFGEQALPDDETHMRAAVVLNNDDALELGQLLCRMLEKQEPEESTGSPTSQE